MDVRCEKCQTEYELDEAGVSAAGVTVKCSTCGHLFKVRRRGDGTQPLGAFGGMSAIPTAAPVQHTQPVVVRAPAAAPASVESPPAGDRPWVVRGPDGSEVRFRELTTLQQWIVERRVGREHLISRTGDSWKRLGDIAELGAFFEIVDQAEVTAHAPGATAPPALPASPPFAATVQNPAALPPFASGYAPGPRSSGPVVMGAAAPVGNEPGLTMGTAQPALPEPSFQMGAPAFNARSTDSFRFSSDPFGGYDDALSVRRGHGLMVTLIVLVLLGGGGAAAWYYVIAPRLDHPAVTATGAPVESAGVQAARELFAKDTEEAYAAAAAKLAAEDPANPNTLAAEVELDATWALELRDDAWIDTNVPAPGVPTDVLTTNARTAEQAAEDKLGAARDAAGRLASMPAADSSVQAVRARALIAALDGKPTADVDALVDKALALHADDAGSLFVRGVLRARDQADDQAVQLFTEADQAAASQGGQGLPRARYQLAMAELRAHRPDAARQALQSVVAASAGHMRAARLLTLLASGPTSAPVVAAADPTPVPVAEAPPGEPRSTGQAGSGTTSGSHPLRTATTTEGSYEALVRDGDTQAEIGHGSQAKADYQKALALRANGAEALLGLGRCFVDEHRFDEARARFDQAAAQGSNEAYFALAELANDQGRAKEALADYKKFLAAGGSGDEAAIAQRQIHEIEERLGSSDGSGTPSGGGETTTVITVPVPTPAPAASQPN